MSSPSPRRQRQAEEDAGRVPRALYTWFGLAVAAPLAGVLGAWLSWEPLQDGCDSGGCDGGTCVVCYVLVPLGCVLLGAIAAGLSFAGSLVLTPALLLISRFIPRAWAKALAAAHLIPIGTAVYLVSQVRC